MKFTTEIIIDMPLMECIKKFYNAENMKHWQRGLVSIEHVSGVPGMVGSKMKLVYKIGKSTMEMIETVSHSRLPNEFHGTYSVKGIDNLQENYFVETENGSTKWTSISDFLPLNFNTRAMLWLMPKAFKKQSIRYMLDFKNFAEKGTSVSHATT